MLTVSTASPYKFASDVLESLGTVADADSLGILSLLSEVSGTKIPAPLSALGEKSVRFYEIISKDEMEHAVLTFASQKQDY